MRRKLQPKRGRQRYAPRMATVEPVFGQIKQGRGFRQFPLRGLEKVQGEWSLICTGHNLLKLSATAVHRPGQHRQTRQPRKTCPPHGFINSHRQSSDGLLGALSSRLAQRL